MNRTLVFAFASLLPITAGAQLTAQPVVVGASYTVNNGPGSQTDPHVSGDLVAYTDETTTTSQIRFHALSSGADQAIPNGGNKDTLSDISGTLIVFTRLGASSHSIYVFDTTAGTSSELNPTPGAMRNNASVGANTVAWEDTGLSGNSAAPEVVAYDLTSGTTTRLTNNALFDGEPAVSPDGSIIVYSECSTVGTSCDIYQATRSGSSWSSVALTGTSGEEARPSTDGVIVAYESERTLNGTVERDIYYQPVGGGPELEIPLGGDQRNASVAGQLIAFESRAAVFGGNYDIYLYDTRTGLLYQLTNTPDDEVLTDIDVDAATGLVRVVYVRDQGGDNNVYAFSFLVTPPDQTCTPSTDGGDDDGGNDEGDHHHHHHHHGFGFGWHHHKPGHHHHGDACDHEDDDEDQVAASACQSPGARPLLATVSVNRTHGAPNVASTGFAATAGAGLLCVENGAPTSRNATSGWVDFDGAQVVSPSAFKKSVTWIGRNVTLQASNSVSARIAGTPGTSYTVRIYGPDPSECTTSAPSISAGALHVHDVGQAAVQTIVGRRVGQPASAANPAAFQDPESFGCSSTPSHGASSGAGALAVLALIALGLRFRPAPVSVRRSRGDRR